MKEISSCLKFDDLKENVICSGIFRVDVNLDSNFSRKRDNIFIKLPFKINSHN